METTMTLFGRLTRKWMGVWHECRAQSALERGSMTEALSHAEAFHSLEPNNPRAHYLLALAYVDFERHAEALMHLHHAAEQWPEDAPTWYAIGVCHDYLDNHRDAIAAYQRTLTLAPHWVIAFKHIGRCAWSLGDSRLAAEALSHYCRAVPDDTEAHDLFGYLAYEQGHLRDAFSHYAQAARLDPRNPKLDRNARLLYHRSATS